MVTLFATFSVWSEFDFGAGPEPTHEGPKARYLTRHVVHAFSIMLQTIEEHPHTQEYDPVWGHLLCSMGNADQTAKGQRPLANNKKESKGLWPCLRAGGPEDFFSKTP